MAAEKPKTQRPTPGRRPVVRRTIYNEKHIIGFLFAVSLLLTGVLGCMLLILVSLHIPDLRSVAHYQPKQATIIYDRNGRPIERIFTENRTVVPLEQMHPLLPKAFVAAEDGRFYEHPGLDLFSVLRAALNNIREGRRGQGGSTITQQVAKSLLLTPEKTYSRKFKEAILAWRIDTLLGKDEILYIYLNQIYLGEGAYGVEAAAQMYFGKSAAELSLGEVALLAGLPQAPSRYSPFKHKDRAVARQRYVLNRMAADGYIAPAQARHAYETALVLQPNAKGTAVENGYYLEEVKKRAARIINRPLQEAGARIYTYLDQPLQQAATRSLIAGLKASRARKSVAGGGQQMPQGALVCLENNTAKVRALVGGRDFIESPFNRATQARRPAGSTFKPFVYAAALSAGWQPQSTISDAPLAVPGAGGGIWRPQNYSGTFHGEPTLAEALTHSYNVASVRLLQKVGIPKVHQLARLAGISAKFPPDLSLALGAVDVSLLEMTAAYGLFVNGGRFASPALIDHIELANKTTVSCGPGKQQQVLKPNVALNMRTMLEAVVREGTGRRGAGLPGMSGGKTGTSDENRDAWFVGFNSRYIAGIWVGHDHNQSLGKTENGGRTATPIWHDFMAVAAQQ